MRSSPGEALPCACPLPAVGPSFFHICPSPWEQTQTALQEPLLARAPGVPTEGVSLGPTNCLMLGSAHKRQLCCWATQGRDTLRESLSSSCFIQDTLYLGFILALGYNSELESEKVLFWGLKSNVRTKSLCPSTSLSRWHLPGEL